MVFIWETCSAGLSFIESWFINVWNSISKCLLLLFWPYTILIYCYSSVKSSHIRIKSYYWLWFSSFQSISCVSSSLLSNVIDCWNVSFLYHELETSSWTCMRVVFMIPIENLISWLQSCYIAHTNYSEILDWLLKFLIETWTSFVIIVGRGLLGVITGGDIMPSV